MKRAETDKPADQQAVSYTDKKPAGNEISERKELPPEYERILDEALKSQYKADSLTQLAGEQKKQLESLPETEKSSLKNEDFSE